MLSPPGRHCLRDCAFLTGAAILGHKGTKSIADYVGIGLSSACVLHCLAMPAFILLWPSLSAAHLEDRTHDILIWLVVPLAIITSWRVLRSKTHRLSPIIILAGLGLIVFGLDTHAHELSFESNMPSIFGSILIVTSHALNLKSQQGEARSCCAKHRHASRQSSGQAHTHSQCEKA